MMHRLLVVLAVSALVGCGGVTEETWNEEVAKVSCETLERCDPITFHRDYGEVDTCVEATTIPDYEGCVFDQAAARDCLDAFEWRCPRLGREYDVWRDTCLAVWDCTNVTDRTDTGGGGVPPL